jgi:hypothetical protein
LLGKDIGTGLFKRIREIGAGCGKDVAVRHLEGIS